MWKRIRTLALTWLVMVIVGEFAFIGWFRMFGSGRSDYGEAFPRERYIRTHLDKPCAFHRGTPCTQEQLAEYHHETTVNFWLDVRDKSVPVLLCLFALLILCILCMILWEKRQRHGRMPKRVRLCR